LVDNYFFLIVGYRLLVIFFLIVSEYLLVILFLLLVIIC